MSKNLKCITKFYLLIAHIYFQLIIADCSLPALIHCNSWSFGLVITRFLCMQEHVSESSPLYLFPFLPTALWQLWDELSSTEFKGSLYYFSQILSACIVLNIGVNGRRRIPLQTKTMWSDKLSYDNIQYVNRRRLKTCWTFSCNSSSLEPLLH